MRDKSLGKSVCNNFKSKVDLLMWNSIYNYSSKSVYNYIFYYFNSISHNYVYSFICQHIFSHER